MQVKMFEKTHMAHRVYMFTSPFITLIGFIMAVKAFETNKIMSILYLVLVIVTIQALLYVYSQSKKAVEVVLTFSEGYFYFMHNAYSLVFPPTAIKSVATKKTGKFVQLFFVLEPTLVKLSGSDKAITTLNVKLTYEDYVQRFKPFYEGTEVPNDETVLKEDAPKQKKPSKFKKQKQQKTTEPINEV